MAHRSCWSNSYGILKLGYVGNLTAAQSLTEFTRLSMRQPFSRENDPSQEVILPGTPFDTSFKLLSRQRFRNLAFMGSVTSFFVAVVKGEVWGANSHWQEVVDSRGQPKGVSDLSQNLCLCEEGV